MQAIAADPSNTSLDPLWPELQARAAAGLISGEALLHLLSLADTLSTDGDWPRAWRALATAEIAAERAEGVGHRAEVASQRGILDYRQGNLRPAITAWEDALAQFTSLAQVEGCANCHANLGAAYKSLGEMQVAQEHLAEALARYREMGYLAGQATALTNLGLKHKDTGAIAEGICCFEEALALFR